VYSEAAGVVAYVQSYKAVQLAKAANLSYSSNAGISCTQHSVLCILHVLAERYRETIAYKHYVLSTSVITGNSR
jgi:catabolite regulation protein CreA